MDPEIEIVSDTSKPQQNGSSNPNPSDPGPAPIVDVYSAAAYGDRQKLRSFVEEEGHSVAKPDGNGYYALQWAALNNYADIAQYIIEHGGDVNAADNTQQTALHWAAVRGSVAVVGVLLQHGARVEAGNSNGYWVIFLQISRGIGLYPHLAPTPLKPQSSGSTSNVVEASGIAKPGEIVPNAGGTMQVNRNVVARPVPSRPWTQNYGSSYNGYGSYMNYNSGYNPYGGSSLYGNTNSYGGGYGGSYGGSGMYGGGNMYSNNYGGMMGGPMAGGPLAGPYGNQDPNDASPPGFWMSFLKVMGGVVHVFGRIAILVDQNTQAFHMFMSALLQLFDQSGLLYGELARLVLRILGIISLSRKRQQGSGELPGLDTQQIAGPTKMYDSVWPGNDPM